MAVNDWTHIQTVLSADGSATSSTTIQQTLTFTGGDFCCGIVAWDSGSSQTLNSVADDLGNQATRFTTVIDTTDAESGAIWYFPTLMVGGSRQITATFSASANFRRMATSEYSGIRYASQSDGETGTFQSAPGTGADKLNSGSIVTHGGGDLIYCASYAGNSNTYSAGTGFTQRAVGGSADNVSMQVEDLRQVSPASIAGTAGCTANNATVTFVAAFSINARGLQPSKLLLPPTAKMVGWRGLNQPMAFPAVQQAVTQHTDTRTLLRVSNQPWRW